MRITKASAAFGSLALGVGLSLVPMSANAAEATTSYAAGQFLSGSLLGTDLANVVELAATEAHNNGTQSTNISKDPLVASVLGATVVNVPGGIQVPLEDYVDAGVVHQYAQAARDGVSMASSGAINDDGGIGAGPVGVGAAGDLGLDLDAALGNEFAAVLADLRLSLEAVAAQANGNKTTASGDYTLAGAVLTFSSPAIGNLTGKVNTALAGVDQQLLALGGDDGMLGNAVDGILDPVLGVVGSSANVTATVSTDVHAAVQSLLTGAYGNGAVSFNLQTGAVSVDLEALLGGDLNDLPANTELLSDAVVSQILEGITETVSTLADQIVDKVELALHNAKVDVHADLNLLTGGGITQTEQCHLVDVPIIGDILTGQPGGGTGGLGGLLGGLGDTLNGLGGTTQGIIGYTTQTVCELVDTVLPSLESKVVLDVEGTVDQIIGGAAAKADASISLLGGTVNAAIDLDGVIDGLGAGLLDGLFDSDGVVSSVVDALDLHLVDPAVTGLLGDTGVGDVLTDVVSVRVNVQETEATATGKTFTQTAVRVAVLSGDAATVDVASATVGPNITRVVDPGCTVNCGPGDPGDPGNPGDPSSPSANNRLAYTGVGIATLIAVILALLAAGAYLAREGYRRNHPQPLS